MTTSLGLLREGLGQIRRRPEIVLESLASWGSRLYEIMRAFVSVRRAAGPSPRDARSALHLRGASARRSTAPPALKRRIFERAIPLAEVKRAAKARGVSVTDFVMATTSGALKRLLDDRGEVLKRDLIAFVPINVRGEGDTAALGNQISGMLVALHTDATDPEERLRAISSDALKTLGEQRAHRAKIFQDVPRVLGPTLLSLGGKVHLRV